MDAVGRDGRPELDSRSGRKAEGDKPVVIGEEKVEQASGLGLGGRREEDGVVHAVVADGGSVVVEDGKGLVEVKELKLGLDLDGQDGNGQEGDQDRTKKARRRSSSLKSSCGRRCGSGPVQVLGG